MKYKKGEEDLEQVEKEIDTLLKGFEGSQIHIPEVRLDKALGEKLSTLQKPKKRHLAKVATGIGVLLLAGTFAVPQVQVFAKEVIESIFKDRGIEEAAKAGYPAIPDLEGVIGEYTVRLFNIYIDAMRLSFEAEVIGLPEEKELSSQKLYYMLNIDDGWQVAGKDVDEVGISNSSFDSGHTTSIDVQGPGVAALLAQEKLEIPLKLATSKYGAKMENGWNIIGECILTLEIPDELREPAKNYALDEEIAIENGNIHLEQLEVSPTMMTLAYSSHLQDGYITGLKDLSIVGKDKDYGERMSISGSYDEKGGVTEYIIPSIYFEKGKQFTLQAEGYSYKKDVLEKISIYSNDILPKTITYDGIPLTITTLNYQDGLLEVGIKDADPKGHYLQQIYINGIPNEGMNIRTYNYESTNPSKPEEREYIVKIKAPQAETYELSLEFTWEKEETICIPIMLK